jgi:hypothetical protein
MKLAGAHKNIPGEKANQTTVHDGTYMLAMDYGRHFKVSIAAFKTGSNSVGPDARDLPCR